MTAFPCCMGMAARDNCTCTDAGPMVGRQEAVRRMVAAEAGRDQLAETLRLRSEALNRVAADRGRLLATLARVEAAINRVDETKSATIMVSAIRAALAGPPHEVEP